MSALAELLPMPTSVTPGSGTLSLGRDGGWAVAGDPELADAAAHVLQEWRGGPSAAAAPLIEVLQDTALPSEGYELHVTTDGVRIAAATPDGARWAAHTLLQLAGTDAVVPACEIRDAPRFAWRGALIDVARHMMPLEWLYSLVRQLSAVKYNRLQLHLSDDEGWRFESRLHPELHRIGGRRPRTDFPNLRPADEHPHVGWYSQEGLRALVEYARALGVRVIPEISMPGHAGAWQRAMPQLAARPEAFGESSPWRVPQQALSLTPECLVVIADVLDELVDVFDSPWIHTGGDEVAAHAWGTENTRAKQARFTGWLLDQVQSRGRALAVWDEAVEGTDLPAVLVTAWRGHEAVRRSALEGHHTIAATHPVLYFDHPQHADDIDVAGSGWRSTWEDVLAYDALDGVERPENVVGSQCQLWTENLPTPRHVEVAAWPRAAAHAQTAWAHPSHDPTTFAPALSAHLGRLDRDGVAHRPFSALPGWWLPEPR
ncbi:MAG: family 20 glycosylhydrolase [Propionibacteriaceae bacterium]|nr:family 20 glycosylhydrolase [Propionibacteriaceae bacterium]